MQPPTDPTDPPGQNLIRYPSPPPPSTSARAAMLLLDLILITAAAIAAGWVLDHV